MSSKELDKRYDPKEVEERWYKFWIEKGLFHADGQNQAPPYSIVIPPPNITGSLHMGHALDNTLQDILIRWRRMQGFNALWMPGTDHAGIATQNVVERKIMAEKSSREAYGRERFVKRVWDWRMESGREIIGQLKRLGSSCDWERERFTMDEGFSIAVKEAFVRLYEDGLIYRGNRLINWCPRCSTALSDLEVEHEEIQGRLYYIRYPLSSGMGSVTIATTRPETMLGDSAVAVNPEDERYGNLIGKSITLPIVRREIPIISDRYVDPEFGTGALKITPAHDPYDFEIGLRHNLPQIKVVDESGMMNEEAGGYAGKDRFECRREILEDLKNGGYLQKIEDHRHSVGHCYRCRTVIEPIISLQWFIRMQPLAEPA
ncbi:MAG: class I tRNA ligase family protein, partial [Nitrospirota bacterium]